MRGAECADVLFVLQALGNKAGAVPVNVYEYNFINDIECNGSVRVKKNVNFYHSRHSATPVILW
jgi:hypothetical protein